MGWKKECPYSDQYKDPPTEYKEKIYAVAEIAMFLSKTMIA